VIEGEVMRDGRRGSVKQAPNGTWWFVVDVGAEGQRKQTRRRGFPTRRAAQSELTRLLGSLEQRQYVAPKRQTLSTFLVETWLPAIEHTIKPGTFESYRRNVRLHVAERPIGRRQLQQVEPSDLNALYALLLAGDADHKPLSARSVRYIATVIHRALRGAVRWQAIIRNPADFADPPKSTAPPEMKTWSAAELGAFLHHVRNDRLAAAWLLLASTGMRRGEALVLREGSNLTSR
jgi:integrase